MHVSAVSFNKKGDKIYTGDAKGFITIIDTKTLEVLICASPSQRVVIATAPQPRSDASKHDTNRSDQIEHSFRVSGGSTIKSIQFSKSGKDFLLNSADRTLRAYVHGPFVTCTAS